MKRLLIVWTALLLLAVPVLAQQGAELTLLEERLLVLPSYNDLYEGVLSAKIQNTGDVALQVKEGLYELLDKDGNKLKYTTWVPVYPGTLEPGEVGYIALNERPDNAATADVIASHALDLKASTDVYARHIRLDATAVALPPRNAYSGAPFLEATVVNMGDAPVRRVSVVYALYDNQGNLLYVQDTTAYNAGIPAGGTILISEDLDGQVAKYLTANDITISRADAIAYVDAE